MFVSLLRVADASLGRAQRDAYRVACRHIVAVASTFDLMIGPSAGKILISN
jgi:hypothetical protein